jgi:hypothetical protein
MVGIHCLLDHQAGRRESPDQGGQPLVGRPSTVVDCDLPYPQEAGEILNIFCVGIYILQQLPSSHHSPAARRVAATKCLARNISTFFPQ